jgi:hypothetical protein
MKIAEWLDQKEKEGADISQIEVPKEMFFKEDPDETIFYKEIKPCGLFCTENHPFATIERFGKWYYCRGQDKAAGIHSSKMKWHFFTKDKGLAFQTAKSRIE